jgi:uncharacterized protein involved in exopolysaccharide biosynthesis
MSSEQEIDLVALWWIVWDHKYLVAATTVVITLLALFYALTATPIYRASVVVTEVRESGLGGESSLANQFGGLASLAGINIGENGVHPERQAVLNSRQLVREFIARKDVLPVYVRDPNKSPSLWVAVERFRRGVLDIQEDKLKGTNTITIDWTDPAVAARWANEFVGLANELLRARAVEDSTRNVAYLNEQIEHTNSVDIQRVMYSLIEAQTKTLMLAKGRVEYAFTIVDPAVTPEVRVSPRRTLIMASGLVAGVMIGTFIAWARIRFARARPLSPH